MVFCCLPLYSEYLEYHLYYKEFKARDFWEAQLSGDAPQRVAGSPKLRKWKMTCKSPKRPLNIVCLMEVWICTNMFEYAYIYGL